jgi:tetratricopeptide (TPR) repeat protein
MNKPKTRGMRPKWSLLIVAVLGAALVLWLLLPGQEETPDQPGGAGAPALAPEPAQQELRQRLEEAQAVPQRVDPQEELLDTIEAQRAAVEADPRSEEAPGLLNAMGNLYLQRLVDYESAAEAYQRLLLEYPDWEGNYSVFPQLEVCYEQLGDGEGLRWLWGLMMERFPPESELHHYGAEQLGVPPGPPSPPEAEAEVVAAESSPEPQAAPAL